MLPLEGLVYLDSAPLYPGPFCSMLLGDLGAEVVKIERPDGGDPVRFIRGFFHSLNRNKRSMTLDLKAPGARDIIYRLVERADIFTEGFRPGVAKRLGIDYETLSGINPRLIYCSISGYGQDGPYRDLTGHDLSYLGMAGILDCLRDSEDDPIIPSIAIADLSSGMFAAIGILSALLAREKTGRGQHVDTSMFDGLISWMGVRLGMFFDKGKMEKRSMAGYGIFRAEDGRHITISIAHEDWFWDRLCLAIGLQELAGISAADRRKRGEELNAKLRDVFTRRPHDEWLDILNKADVPVSPVKDLQEVSEDPHVKFRKLIEEITLKSGERIRHVGFPVKLSETPASTRRPPPELGEHTAEILAWLGYSQDETAELKRKAII